VQSHRRDCKIRFKMYLLRFTVAVAVIVWGYANLYFLKDQNSAILLEMIYYFYVYVIYF